MDINVLPDTTDTSDSEERIAYRSENGGVNDEEIREKILSQDYAEFIYPESEPSESVYERYNAVFSQTISRRYSTLYAPLSKIQQLVLSNYGYNFIPKLYGLMDTSALETSGITRLAYQPILNLRGQGVIIGIVDTGIDYTNPVFMDEQGNTRILRIWDQSSNEGRLPALDIKYGSEYTEEDINRAIKSDDPYSIVGQRDENGHGTFMAGVAGGSPNVQNGFSGAATEAKFIVVKLKPAKDYLREYNFVSEDAVAYQENDILLAANYIRTYGIIFNMPVSLVLGLGSNQGGHDGKTMLSQELSIYYSRSGTTVCVAAGNEGNERHHYRGEIKNQREVKEVELHVAERLPGLTMEIWVNKPLVFSVGMVSPTGEVVERIPARIGSAQMISLLFEKTKIYIGYDLVDSSTGDELIYLRFQNPTEGIWRIRVFASGDSLGGFDCWLPITNFIGSDTYFLEPDPYVTITDPGMAENVITVSVYNSANGAFYKESGRGFSRRGLVKPDIAAPGVNITGPTLAGGFENRSGSSYAAAITAGACAQFLTWARVEGNIVWVSPELVSGYLARGAVREADRTYPNEEWGYGKLNIYDVFEVMRNS